MSDWNGRIIEEFRTNGGTVTTAGFGDTLVVIHGRGAKTGEERLAPVRAIPDGDAWLVAASKAGAPTHPAWFHNLVAHPDVDIEVPDPPSVRTVPVHAVVLEGAERDAAYQRFIAASPMFGQYQEKTGGRIIPVVRLERR